MRPQFKITVGSTDYINTEFISGRITQNENGFDNAVLRCNNKNAKHFLNDFTPGTIVSIFLREPLPDQPSVWPTLPVLKGPIRFTPGMYDNRGFWQDVNIDGAGYGLIETVCGAEYGSESARSAIDTLKEVLIWSSAVHGIIPGFVNRILEAGASGDSGYNYDTEVEAIAGTIKYIYFPYQPCAVAIKDLCDVVQAIKGTNPGPHWIVLPSSTPKLVVTTVGNHHAGAVSAGWDTYYKGSQAASTLEQRNILQSNIQSLAKEANYILYHGACLYPTKGDWAENNSLSWGKDDVSQTLSDDNSVKVVGDYSVKVSTTHNGWPNLTIHYPNGENLDLDITPLGGRYNHPTINFYCRKNSEITNVGFEICTNIGTSGYLLKNTLNMMDNKWTAFSVPVGPYAETDFWDSIGGFGPVDWTHIDSIRFWLTHAANANNKYFWVDGLHFAGTVKRVAKQSAGYSSSDPVKMKVINDNVAKGDSLVASDDSGTIARLAYAEYLRCKTTPLVGWIQTRFLPTLLPGQLVHIHNEKISAGAYRIDKDMRVTQHIIDFSRLGFWSTLQLTDDLTNSNVRSSFADTNTVMRASREWENRQATSIKTREIDITQANLEKSY